ncbi:hypothetical protein K458DRAFT_38828 [Lentithecium fluviatile CBS 122367]|uniref:Uncharacterized protein n=1 Tax=Lentithecium fluviatile CBS 122367 TaxID=1168545 RepID=A0A6G1J117_9PLEO|nr:hypothetical protein K458DRAFT_38828 [Lentithecium fluviatile CBS 122367]
MTLLNQPSQHTFMRNGTRTTIDLGFASPDLAKRVKRWRRCLELQTTQDNHLFIETVFNISAKKEHIVRRAWHRLDIEKLREVLRRELRELGLPDLKTKADIDKYVDALVRIPQQAQEDCVPPRSPGCPQT